MVVRLLGEILDNVLYEMTHFVWECSVEDRYSLMLGQIKEIATALSVA